MMRSLGWSPWSGLVAKQVTYVHPQSDETRQPMILVYCHARSQDTLMQVGSLHHILSPLNFQTCTSSIYTRIIMIKSHFFVIINFFFFERTREKFLFVCCSIFCHLILAQIRGKTRSSFARKTVCVNIKHILSFSSPGLLLTTLRCNRLFSSLTILLFSCFFFLFNC